MSSHAGVDASPNYFLQVLALARMSVAQLLRRPSHARRAEAARRSARKTALLAAILGAAVIALMVGVDAREIVMMPPRGDAALWAVRILTDFGKPAYVLWLLAAMLMSVAIVAPCLRGRSRSLLFGLGTRLQFVFFAVLVPVLAGEIIKWSVGRGRPFTGGAANVFNFAPFNGTEAYASFPSAHAIVSFALAFAVAAVWPRTRVPMLLYAVVIAASRLVLLAHHPSDVVAGALIGLVGAMWVRYWFAARRLAFAIGSDGAIMPLRGPSLAYQKSVAHGAPAP
jgi:membrane-associated phospholipid phosphatase